MNLGSREIILIVGVLCCVYIIKDTSPLFLIVCSVVLALFYKDLISLVTMEKSKRDTVRSNDQIKRKDIRMNPELSELVRKLRSYKRYNHNGYREGKRYLKMFMSNLNETLREDMSHPKQTFENAQAYLKISLNHFNSLIYSVPESNYNSSLKYNKNTSHKIIKNISQICKDIHRQGYSLLFSVSRKLNQEFYENPDIYKSEITMSSENVNPANDHTIHELY